LFTNGAFDMWFVQFYDDTRCHAPNYNFEDWQDWAKGNDTQFFVRLPANSNAAPSGGYVDPNNLKPYLDKANDRMKGVMLWDASQAWANNNYHKDAKKILQAFA
jgi:chitinase